MPNVYASAPERNGRRRALKDRRAKKYARTATRSLRAGSAPPARPASVLGTDSDGTPIVAARRESWRGDEVLIVDHCAFCLTKHVHGACGPELGAGDGLALAHCGLGSYDIREVA